MVHIDDFPLLQNTQVTLGILSSCVIHQPSYFIWTIHFSFSFLSILASFDERVMQVCGDIMHPGSWEFIQRSLMGYQAQLPISFGGINLLFMENYAPYAFLGNLALVALYLCSKFPIFNKPFWKSMFFKLKEVHTSFNHAFMQFEIVFLPQLERCTLFLRVW